MLDFHRRWDLDFIKVMSSGVFDAMAELPVGGLGEGSTLRRGPVAAIAEQVRDAVRQAAGVGVIAGPGCVLPLDVPDAHLAAVVDTVATLR